ncbi:MAG: type III pantothenate kinase [Ignavibacteriales bacterium]|nr:type III pantothenate kinase [Ignavibacteriales bacterium]
MLLCLDIGNTQIYGGVFSDEKIIFQFRFSTRQTFSSDEVGVFLRSVLKENNITPESIKNIAMCSVVPDVVYSVRNGCIKYFEIDPFILQAGVKTGLKIKYLNPQEVGSDRIANAIAAINLHPNKNIIVIDFGTATTFDIISKEKEYLGGAIVPGIRISMESLESRTAKLPAIEISRPEKVVGKTTKESIQSGLYFGHIGIIKEIIQRSNQEAFGGTKSFVIGTGGFANMFNDTGIFDAIYPDLVLTGINLAYKMNLEKEK